MRAPLARAGLDTRQLRVLFVAGLKLDYRSPAPLQQGTSGWARWVPQLMMYGMFGLMLAGMVWFVPDVFLSGSLVLTGIMFFEAAALLTEFGVVAISPLDYDVLGYQPISSRTYFAARLANVLFYVGVIGTAAGLPPLGAYFFARGFNPALGVAALVAFYAAIAATALAVVVAYVGVARLVHPERLKRALTYVQLVISMAVYGGYFLLPSLFHVSALKTWRVEKSAWMLLYPPTWFASVLDLAVGRRSALEILPAIAGAGSLVALAWTAAGRLSLDYSALLARQAASTEPVRRRARRRSIRYGTGEHRAIAMLLRAQFRHDQRFRMMVLSIVPLTILYMFIGVSQGGLKDPFVEASGSNAFLLYFAMVMFPAMLMAGVSRSDGYRAAWVFYVTPANRAGLVLAVKDLALVYFLGPYMLAVAAALSYFFGSVPHALVHMTVEALVVNLLLLLVVALQPDLPFSKPVQKGQTSAWLLIVMLVGAIGQALLTTLLALVVYPYPIALGSVIAGLLAAGAGGQRLLRRRLERWSAAEEFAG